MNNSTASRPVARTAVRTLALLSAAALAATTTGCSVIDAITNKPRHTHFDTAAELADDPSVTADWVPSTSTNLRLIMAADGSSSSLLIDTPTALDTTLCVKTERESAPNLVLEEAPEAYDVTTVFACGDWSVIPSDGGWWGWTPNSTGEEAASASASGSPSASASAPASASASARASAPASRR